MYNVPQFIYLHKQLTINSIIRIHAFDIGLQRRCVLVVVFMLCRVINKEFITLPPTRLVSFIRRTNSPMVRISYDSHRINNSTLFEHK